MRPLRAEDEADNDYDNDDEQPSQRCTIVLYTVEPLGHRDWESKSII